MTHEYSSANPAHVAMLKDFYQALVAGKADVALGYFHEDARLD
jgi:hypothetical protein